MKIIDEIVYTDPAADATNGPGDKYNARKHGAVDPDYVIIHGTGGKDYDYAKNRLYDPNIGISCHFIIKEDGTITRMVPEDKRAYHTGQSRWKDMTSITKEVNVPDINSRSIGIEMSNRIEPGKKKRNEYTKEQVKALTELCQYLQDKYNIPAENIIGHADIAPGRKQDPWETFPWKKLSKKGIGLWPNAKLSDHFKAMSVKKSPSKVLELMQSTGYQRWQYGKKKDGSPINVTIKDDVSAFQLHYMPKTFMKNKGEAKLSNKTVAKMIALSRLHK